MIFLLIVAWLLSGFSSFVYWWTKDFDFTTGQVFHSVIASVLGPIAFLWGWAIHGSSYVIIKRRGGDQ